MFVPVRTFTSLKEMIALRLKSIGDQCASRNRMAAPSLMVRMSPLRRKPAGSFGHQEATLVVVILFNKICILICGALAPIAPRRG
jgi:hypothetical protein